MILQNWIKRMLQRKKLIKLIPQLIPLYYHPDAKGGYFDKKRLFEFIESITYSPSYKKRKTK